MTNLIFDAPRAPPSARSGPASVRKAVAKKKRETEKVSAPPSSTRPRFAGFSSHAAFFALLCKDLVSLGHSMAYIDACQKEGVEMLLSNLPRDGGGLKQLAEKVTLLDLLISCLCGTFGKTSPDGTRIGWVKGVQAMLKNQVETARREMQAVEELHLLRGSKPVKADASTQDHLNAPMRATTIDASTQCSRALTKHTNTGTQCSQPSIPTSPIPPPSPSLCARCMLVVEQGKEGEEMLETHSSEHPSRSSASTTHPSTASSPTSASSSTSATKRRNRCKLGVVIPLLPRGVDQGTQCGLKETPSLPWIKLSDMGTQCTSLARFAECSDVGVQCCVPVVVKRRRDCSCQVNGRHGMDGMDGNGMDGHKEWMGLHYSQAVKNTIGGKNLTRCRSALVWDDDRPRDGGANDGGEGDGGALVVFSSTTPGYINREEETLTTNGQKVSVASQSEIWYSEESTQCNIAERPPLERSNQALEQARARLTLEKQQTVELEKRAGELEMKAENLKNLCTSHAKQTDHYCRKVSDLEKILASYQKTVKDQCVATDEATVWCYSFQHKDKPILRTFDKEVQTLRQVGVESLLSPRFGSQMLAFGNRRN